MSRIGKSIETEHSLVVARGWGEGRGRNNCLMGYRVFFWSDKNVLELDRGGGCTTL